MSVGERVGHTPHTALSLSDTHTVAGSLVEGSSRQTLWYNESSLQLHQLIVESPQKIEVTGVARCLLKLRPQTLGRGGELTDGAVEVF